MNRVSTQILPTNVTEWADDIGICSSDLAMIGEPAPSANVLLVDISPFPNDQSIAPMDHSNRSSQITLVSEGLYEPEVVTGSMPWMTDELLQAADFERAIRAGEHAYRRRRRASEPPPKATQARTGVWSGISKIRRKARFRIVRIWRVGAAFPSSTVTEKAAYVTSDKNSTQIQRRPRRWIGGAGKMAKHWLAVILNTVTLTTNRKKKHTNVESTMGPNGDDGISLPWNFTHLHHVDRRLSGLPVDFFYQLQASGEYLRLTGAMHSQG